jgi:hypothetical protein
MPAWDNLNEFLDLDDFAVQASVQLQGGGAPLHVPGIFDDPFLNAQLGEYEPDSSAPRFVCKASLVGAVRRGDALTLTPPNASAPVTFDVLRAPEPDGTGMATIHLAVPPPKMR